MNKLGKNKKLVEGDHANEWRKSGSFVNKPARGWLHPDNSVNGPGVIYTVRYLGCIEIRQSMRTLQFDMRTQATKEAIWRVLAAAGRVHVSGRNHKKPAKEVAKILGDFPNLQFSQALINLTISTASLTLVVSDTGQFIANHQMQSISFASGGDPENLDYVAYVAKDPINNRACHVLECTDGLAQDVINTIGQAFELRFKEYLKNPPIAVSPPDRTEPLFHDGKSRWGDDEPEYYNDISGKPPPESGMVDMRLNNHENHQAQLSQHNHKLSDSSMRGMIAPGSDFNNVVRQQQPPVKNFQDHNYVNTELIAANQSKSRAHESNPSNLIDLSSPPTSPQKYAHGGDGGVLEIAAAMGVSHSHKNHESSSSVDAFDMKPFEKALQMPVSSLQQEPWFHGKVFRPIAETILKQDGDFLVRESSSTAGQFVLSGLHDGQYKHLLLVDPHGVVRTKDRRFDSVEHLISYHRRNNLPIVSAGSMLLLKEPVVRQIER